MSVHGIAIEEPPALEEVCACHAVGEVYDEQFDVNICAWTVEVWKRALLNVVDVELEVSRRVLESSLSLIVNWLISEIDPAVTHEERGIRGEGCCARRDVRVRGRAGTQLEPSVHAETGSRRGNTRARGGISITTDRAVRERRTNGRDREKDKSYGHYGFLYFLSLLPQY